MCLYPKFIKNQKYLPNKKNKGIVQNPTDRRILYVPVGCGNCIECRKQKAQAWRVRLQEEFKTDKKCYFVTLSFSPEALQEIANMLIKTDKYNIITEIECNAVATKAVRLFLERWRKKYKKSVKHWLITELGDKYTERIHLHGIIWTDKPKKEIDNIWKYGNTWIGDYCNEKTINYIIKYITKTDLKHKTYKAVVLCSAGIGKNYLKTLNALNNKYNGTATNQKYKLNNGTEVNLPIYYRNHIYTEEQREKLWLQTLDKHVKYILGIEHDISTEENIKLANEILKVAQEKNERLNYGTDKDNWNEESWNITTRMLNKLNKA